MKVKVTGLLVLAVLLGLCVGQAPAQEKKSQMYLVEEVLVKPSADAAFYELEKEAVALCQKQKWPYAWTCYAADDYRYYFVIPIANLAEVDSYYKAAAEFFAKNGAEFKPLLDKFSDLAEYDRYFILTYNPELSMIPEKPRYKPGETDFFSIDIWYIKPGKEMEVEKTLFSEFMTLAKKKGVKDTWYCLVGGLGTEQPVYYMAGPDTLVEFFKHNAEMWKLLGKDAGDMQKKMLSFCRKRESAMAWYTPELSYTPQK
jgi:hypothetical protein